MPLPLGGSDHRKDSRLEKQHVDSITSELGDWSDFVLIPWSALATWNKHSWTVFWSSFQGYPTCQVLVMCQVPDMKDGQVGCPWKGFSKYSTGLHWDGTQNICLSIKNFDSKCNIKLPGSFRNPPPLPPKKQYEYFYCILSVLHQIFANKLGELWLLDLTLCLENDFCK